MQTSGMSWDKIIISLGPVVTNTHNKIQWIIYYKASIELWISFSLLSCQLVRLDLYVVSRSKAEYRNVTLGYFFWIGTARLLFIISVRRMEKFLGLVHMLFKWRLKTFVPGGLTYCHTTLQEYLPLLYYRYFFGGWRGTFTICHLPRFLAFSIIRLSATWQSSIQYNNYITSK